MNEINTEFYGDYVSRCNNEEWDRCCECCYWDNCELKYDRFPGLIPVIKKFLKNRFNKDERPGK